MHSRLVAILAAVFLVHACASDRLPPSPPQPAPTPVPQASQRSDPDSDAFAHRIARIVGRLATAAEGLENKDGRIPGAGMRIKVELYRDDAVAAMCDRNNVYVSSGMVRFAKSDDELAFLIGHEIAHQLLDHIPATGIVDHIYVRNPAQSAVRFPAEHQTEYEADFLGAYLAARAGFEVAGCSQFYTRLAGWPARRQTAAVEAGAKKRVLACDRAAAEIKQAGDRNQALVPNMQRLDEALSSRAR